MDSYEFYTMELVWALVGYSYLPHFALALLEDRLLASMEITEKVPKNTITVMSNNNNILTCMLVGAMAVCLTFGLHTIFENNLGLDPNTAGLACFTALTLTHVYLLTIKIRGFMLLKKKAKKLLAEWRFK